MASLPLAGKVAIVTGASRSIGAALATRLGSSLVYFYHAILIVLIRIYLPARDGAKVVINYVSNATAAQEVMTSIAAEGKGEGFPIKADIGNPEGRQLLIDKTLEKWQKIDIL